MRKASAICCAGTCAAARAIRQSCARQSRPRRNWQIRAERKQMLDLGTSFVASVARDPNALAIVDEGVRLTYAQWYARISSLVASFDRIGLKPGDHLVTVLQNCEAAATLHWACQLAGIVVTPVNWRAKADELDYCVEDSESCAVVYQDVSAQAVEQSTRAQTLPRIYAGSGGAADAFLFDRMVAELAADATPRVSAEAWSIMLYT